MQKQLAQIAETVAETYQSVKMIEKGQQDDRVALIDAGREQILLATSLFMMGEKAIIFYVLVELALKKISYEQLECFQGLLKAILTGN